MNGADVRAAAEACVEFLTDASDADWSLGVPDLDWTVSEVVAHAAEGCLWYAIDLAAAGRELQAVEHRVKPSTGPSDLVDTMRAYAEVVASVIDIAPPSARGFHPMGAADPGGFAAMASDELLVHTYDAGRGLGRAFTPPGDLAAKTLGRLFPWVPVDGDSWPGLLWANGRIELPGRARLVRWRWHCAPLHEWDGRAPVGQE
jgi:uncharacterized protein (TIGR03083 family)